MSVHAARGFLPTLRNVERDLAVPIPERTRILRELEFDLEELQSELMARGSSLESARDRALEVLVPGPGAIRDLGRVHASAYRRGTVHLGADRLRFLERSALATATAAVLFVQTLALLGAGLLDDPSPYLWPVLGLGALLFSMILAKTFELWVKRDHRRLEPSLSGLLGLSAVILGAGCLGVVLDLYTLAGLLEQSPEPLPMLAVRWLVRDCVLLSVAILLALAGAFTWLVLTQWFTRHSVAHRDALGLELNVVTQTIGDQK